MWIDTPDARFAYTRLIIVYTLPHITFKTITDQLNFQIVPQSLSDCPTYYYLSIIKKKLDNWKYKEIVYEIEKMELTFQMYICMRRLLSTYNAS